MPLQPDGAEEGGEDWGIRRRQGALQIYRRRTNAGGRCKTRVGIYAEEAPLQLDSAAQNEGS